MRHYKCARGIPFPGCEFTLTPSGSLDTHLHTVCLAESVTRRSFGNIVTFKVSSEEINTETLNRANSSFRHARVLRTWTTSQSHPRAAVQGDSWQSDFGISRLNHIARDFQWLAGTERPWSWRIMPSWLAGRAL
ncbi:hypothetical protein AGOR_G00226670 [Albula goreensis]|uniref:Uncharacterized protein n=1 Tax=Albula goreensis TaxID=1534307 RepID=A0A8T3CP24_9TELE|nr:hypothetical protein AGOR_G00226670 [Albula goreensis]